MAVDFWRTGLELLHRERIVEETERTISAVIENAEGPVDTIISELRRTCGSLATTDQLTRTAVHLFEEVISYCKRDVLLTRQIYDKLVESDGVIQYYNWQTRGRPKIKLRMG